MPSQSSPRASSGADLELLGATKVSGAIAKQPNLDLGGSHWDIPLAHKSMVMIGYVYDIKCMT